MAMMITCSGKQNTYGSHSRRDLRSEAIRGLAKSVRDLWTQTFWRKIPTNVVMLGLDAAGKTAVLYKLRLGKAVQTIPTMGFNTETIPYKNFEFRIWDVGGQDRIRALWQHHLDGARVVIFVVDSADKDRLPQAATELHKLMRDPRLRDAYLLVYANKQDQRHAITAREMVERLDLSSISDRSWFLQGSNARTGEGLYEGLDWLVSELLIEKDLAAEAAAAATQGSSRMRFF